jgi:hypothetical protein
MPKKEILKLKSAPRLEQVGDNCPKQMEHRDHRVDDELILPYRANRADGIFGNDRWNNVPRGTMGEVRSHVRVSLPFSLPARSRNRLFRLVFESHDGRCYGAAARILHPSLLM